MTPERFTKIRTILDQRQPDLSILLDNVHKPHNFSAIVRSCDAYGVLNVYGVWPNKRIKPNPQCAGGAEKWVNVHTMDSIELAIARLKQQGLRIYAAHPDKNALDFRQVDYTQPTVFLLGAELDGLSEAALTLADSCLTIPMYGMVESFNVSVTAAILLNEAATQRQQAGMYRKSRLPADLYQQMLFEWTHPTIAQYCHEKRLAYPDLDKQGEITKSFRINN